MLELMRRCPNCRCAWTSIFNALDDYALEEAYWINEAARNIDEKMDWANIPIEQLNRCYSSPSFFDAEGMRFHLPAFMICDLKNEYNFDFCFSLTQINDYKMTQFSNLNKKQRQAVQPLLTLCNGDR